MIQLNHVERSHKTGAGENWVLRRIGLGIERGEFVTIMGPSGAGKSSLLNVLALLDDGWKGEYWFHDQPVHSLRRNERANLARRNIGMVFQSYHLLDDLTVAENIDLPLSYKDIPSKQRQGLVADALDRFQIVAKKTSIPASFPVANSNWSELRGPWSISLRCWLRTSRPEICIPLKPRKLWICFANSIREGPPSFRSRIQTLTQHMEIALCNCGMVGS